MKDLIITKIFEPKAEPEYGYGFRMNKATGIGFIANHEIFRKIIEEDDFWYEYRGRKHKTDFGDIYLLNITTDRTFEFVAAGELEIPIKLFPILVRRQ